MNRDKRRLEIARKLAAESLKDLHFIEEEFIPPKVIPF